MASSTRCVSRVIFVHGLLALAALAGATPLLLAAASASAQPAPSGRALPGPAPALPPPPPPYSRGPVPGYGPSTFAAPSELPAPVRAGVHVHDGFYYRFAFGPGTSRVSSKVVFPGGSGGYETTTGGGVGFDLAVGGTPAPGLALGGSSIFQQVSAVTRDTYIGIL